MVGRQVGNYRLTQLLGHGGFADVYLGEHIYLHTQAAIKILHTQLDQENIETFRKEALTIAHLVHPHIIRVLDFNVEDAVPFLVMDYAPNGSLRERYPKGKRVPPESIISYVKQVASALQYAHDHNLIHRDVKPGNMLLDENDNLLLSDFGIALVAENSQSQKTEDEMIGTMAYMAPEQITGKARPASDQYALAAVVYEWISGKRPFKGSYFEMVAQHLSAEPDPLSEYVSDIRPAVEQVIRRALAKDPHQRFPRVQDFADALEQAWYAPEDQHAAAKAAPVILPPPPAISNDLTDRDRQYDIPVALHQTVSAPPPPRRQSTPLYPAASQSIPFAPPQYSVTGSKRQAGAQAFHVVRRGIGLLLSLILLGALAVCGLGYATLQYFTSRNAPALTQADVTNATNTASAFVANISQRNYDAAYAAFSDSLKHQTAQQDFVQQAQQEDGCYGDVTSSTRVDNATTIRGNAVSYQYIVRRSKLSKTYQLTLTVQQQASSWRITDYNSNVDQVQSACT